MSEVPQPPEEIPEWDRPGCTILYSECDFKGREYVLLKPGTYNWCMGTLLIGNGKVSSIKVPPGYRVTVYENATIGRLCGRTEVLFQDTAKLMFGGRVMGLQVDIVDARQNHRYPDECKIGNSSKQTTTVHVPQGTRVPAICGPDCRRNEAKGPDTFKLKVIGDQLEVQRTDSSSGWNSNLKVACRKPI